MSTLTPTISALPDSHLPDSPRSLWSDAWQRLSRRPSALICMVIVALYLLVGLATFLPIFEKKISDPVADGYQAPSLGKFSLLLGADIQGRPVVWRLLYGTRVALLITIFASILSLGIGVFLGILAGYFGGWIDEIITWLFTTVSSIPWVLLMIAMVYALKGMDLDPVVMIVLALGLTDWVGICRLIRAEVLKHRDRDYARILGQKRQRVGADPIVELFDKAALFSFAQEHDAGSAARNDALRQGLDRNIWVCHVRFLQSNGQRVA